MRADREPRLTLKMRLAVEELKALVLEHYPDATFEVARDPDSPHGIDVWTTVDLDDPVEVLDLVLERVLELQIEEGLPVHVVPVRTPERSAKIRAEQEHERRLAAHVPVIG